MGHMELYKEHVDSVILANFNIETKIIGAAKKNVFKKGQVKNL